LRVRSDAHPLLKFRLSHKEFAMKSITLIDLGKASQETRHMGKGLGDSIFVPDSEPGT